MCHFPAAVKREASVETGDTIAFLYGIVLTDEDRQNIVEEMAAIDAERLTVTDLSMLRELGRRQRHLANELQAGHRLPMSKIIERYDFEIVPRKAELGGGWRLYLIEDGKEVGGGVFPAAPDEAAAAGWWETLGREQRIHWTTRGLADCKGNAYLSYLREDAWHDAAQTAGEWLDSRPQA